MTPQERLAAAVEMSEDVRALAEAGIRQHHPAYADAEVREALLKILLGPELARRASAPGSRKPR